MKVYQFKVSLDHNKRIYRNIEILEIQTLADLHEAIFRAFDRYEEHLYSFYLTGKRTKNRRSICDSPEYTIILEPGDEAMPFIGDEKNDASKARIGSLGLKDKSIFYYLFDFGDSWWHEVTLLAVREADADSGYPKVVKRAGESPEQYPDEDEE